MRWGRCNLIPQLTCEDVSNFVYFTALGMSREPTFTVLVSLTDWGELPLSVVPFLSRQERNRKKATRFAAFSYL